MLLALSVLAVLHAPPPVPGCTSRGGERGASSFDCGDGVIVARWDMGGPTSGPNDARHTVDGFTEIVLAKKPARHERARERVGGEDAEVLRAEFPGEHALYAALDRPEGVRVLICKEPKQARCAALLDAFARTPWDYGAPRQQTLLGRRVEVPGACALEQSAVAGRLQCPNGAELAWLWFPDDARAEHAATDFEQTVGAEHGGERETVACRVAGAEARCDRRRWIRGGRPATDLLARVKIGDDRYVVFCTVGSPTGEGVPCTLAFELP